MEEPMQEDRIHKLPVEEMLNKELSSIPSDTDKTELPQKAEKFLRLLAEQDEVCWEPYLTKFKGRFSLSGRELEPYRKLVRKYNKQFYERLDQPNSRKPVDTDQKYTAHFPGLVDIVELDGKTAFLIKTGKGIEVTDRATVEGEIYFPPPKDKLPWKLPRWSEVQRHFHRNSPDHIAEADAALYDDLVKYHKGISELPGEDYYHLLAAWDMHTHLIESFIHSPILWLYGLPGRGKSRTGEGVVYVAYRGIMVVTLREAHLLRYAENHHATLFIDLSDIQAQARRNNSLDILLHRFQQGGKVPRVLHLDAGPFKDTEHYSVYGATLIGTNEAVHGPLEDRTLQIRMPSTENKFNLYPTDKGGLELKERLTAFRAMHLGEPLPEVEKPFASRLGDLLKPLLQVVALVRPEQCKTLEQLGERLKVEKAFDKDDSLDSQIIRAIDCLVQEGAKITNGTLPVQDITKGINGEDRWASSITPQKIGRRLKAMGFDKCHTGTGASAIIVDVNKVARLKEEHGL